MLTCSARVTRVHGRVLGARLRCQRLSVERALQEAVDRGHSSISSEAVELRETLSTSAGGLSDGGAEKVKRA